jgi:rRNA maturation endonuclease Nob1
MTELWVVCRDCFMPQPETTKCRSCGSKRLEPYRAPHSLDAEFRKPSKVILGLVR